MAAVLFVWVLMLAAAGLILGWRWLRRDEATRSATAWLKHERMPADLQRGQLVASEQEMRVVDPISLHGRLDQAYRLEDGRHVIVDSKRRRTPVVHRKDVLQVSTYALMLRWGGFVEQGPLPIADYGYIRFKLHDGSVRYVRFELMSEELVRAYYRRYFELREDRYQDFEYRPSPGLCGLCARRWRCRHSMAKDDKPLRRMRA